MALTIMRKLLIAIWLFVTCVIRAANPSFGDFNINQFRNDSNHLSIRVFAPITNLVIEGTAVQTNALVRTSNPGKVLTTITNNVGILTNDGSGNFGFTTNITQDITINNFTVTNLTVLNNLVVSNLYTVNGNHNTLIVTNSLTIQPVKTNLLATTSTGLVTNANYGTGISWDPTTRTISATATGSGLSTHVTTLTWSGTNAVGFNAATNGETFIITLTNNVLFGTSTFSNLPNKDEYKTFALGLQQDSTGGRIVTFTNSVVSWALGVPAFIETNANAYSMVYFHTHTFTNGMLAATPNVDIR
jgi:hypothetical protein